MRILILLLAAIFAVDVHAQVEMVVQSGHTGNITFQLFQKKKNALLTAGSDGRILEWELKNGWQTRSFQTEQDGVTCMALSINEDYLLSGGGDNSIVLLDMNSGKVLKRWVPFKYAASSVAFSADGKYLLATSRDFSLWKCEWQTGKTEQVYAADDLLGLNVSANGSLYFGCRNGSIYTTDLNNISKQYWKLIADFDDEITELQLSPDGKYLAAGTASHYVNDQPQPGIFAVFDVASARHVMKVPDFDMSITPHQQSIQWVDDKTIVYSNQSDTLTRVLLTDMQPVKLNYKAYRFQYNSTAKLLAIPSDNMVNIYKAGNVEPRFSLEGKVAIPKKMWLSGDSSLMVEYDNGFKNWNLRVGRAKSVEDKFYNNEKESGFTISHNGRYTVRNERDLLQIYDNKYPDNEGFIPGSMMMISNASMFSNNDRYLAVISENKGFYVFDADESFNIVIETQLHLGKNRQYEIPKMVFSPDNKYVAVLGTDIWLFDLNKKAVATLDAQRRALFTNLDAVFSNDGNHLISASHHVYSLPELPADTNNKEIIHVPASAMGEAFYLINEPGVLKQWSVNNAAQTANYFVQPHGNKIGDATALLFADDENIFVGTSDARVLKMNIKTGKVTTTVKDHNDYVFEMIHLHDKHLLITASYDGTIKLRHDETLKPIATLMVLKNHGYIITDSAGFYKRSKAGAAGIILKNKEQVLQPEQYDLYLNQPQQVLQKIGMSSKELIELFTELHGKKMKGLVKSATFDLSKKIEVSIENEDELPTLTSEKTIRLNVNVSAINTTGRMLFVTVNGVPVNGSKGFSIEVKNGQIEKQDVDVTLSRGINNIAVKVYGEEGVASAEHTVRISHKPAVTKRPDMYVIVISVSSYLDSSMNLKLAVKDGKDFLNIWKKDGKKTLGFPSQFANVYDYVLFDEAVTRENILSLKDSLVRAKEEDMVMVYLSGHGMLDNNYTFWYGTHPVDFSNPSVGGISYAELEGLLDNIKPLRKVMFMDACHSGEVDKTLVKDISTGNVVAGARSTIKVNQTGGRKVKESKDLGSTFEQMQEMFNSFSKNSGAIVISAAAGTGYAYEDEKWNNGVFTYALVNGLKNKAADLNKDGDITIDELSSYVAKQVETLTNGMQKPNERQENTKNIFRIW